MKNLGIGLLIASMIPFGFWQENTFDVSSANLGGYYFNNDSFEYRVNEYDNLNPIRSFGGTYKIFCDSIQFRVLYVKMLTKGSIQRSQITSYNGSWEYSGEEFTTIWFDNPTINEAEIKLNKDTLQIDGNTYYHIDNE